MKKISLVTFMLPFALLLLTVISCKKEAAEKEPATNAEIKEKVRAWLQEKKAQFPTGKSNQEMSERLQSLQDNLDFEKTRYEQRNEQEKFAVIPVKETFTSQNNKDKKPFNYLVVALDQQATITKGNLIQFVPEGERTPAPLHTFAKIYTHQKLEASGTFTVLSVTDDFRYELKFEKGKIKAITDRVRKKNLSTGRTSGCTDWYYQTWAVWEDGSMTLISEVYVATTCDGDCWQAKAINGKSFRAECSGSNGGGDIDYDYVHVQPESDNLTTETSQQTFDLNTGLITMNVGYRWRCGSGSGYFASSFYNWNYWSYESGVVVKQNQTDTWKFQAPLTHLTIEREGITPPGYIIRHNLASAISNIVFAGRAARMQIEFFVYEEVIGVGQTKSWRMPGKIDCLAP